MIVLATSLVITILILLFICETTTNFKQNIVTYSRIAIQWSIGVILIGSNLSYSWEESTITSTVPFIAGCPKNINLSIHLGIGIKGFRTILSSSALKDGCLKYETIAYDQKFMWNINSENTIQKQLVHARNIKMPKPIVWIVEHFSAEEHWFLQGPFSKEAELFCEICLWISFGFYLGSIALFHLSLIKSGAFWLGLSGLFQLFVSLAWITIRSFTNLEIYFETAILRPHLGWSYWLNLGNGMTCLVICIGLIVLDSKFQKHLNGWFNKKFICLFKSETIISQRRSSLIPLATIQAFFVEDSDDYEMIP